MHHSWIFARVRKRFISTAPLPYDILCGANLDGGASLLAGAVEHPSSCVAPLSTSGNTQSQSGHDGSRAVREQCDAEDSYDQLG